jgi:hypothetical protein
MAHLDSVPDLRKALNSQQRTARRHLRGLRRDGQLRQDRPEARTRRDHHTQATAAKRLRPLRGAVAGTRHSGGGIRTRDLRVMSPTSYQTAPPRGGPISLAKAPQRPHKGPTKAPHEPRRPQAAHKHITARPAPHRIAQVTPSTQATAPGRPHRSTPFLKAPRAASLYHPRACAPPSSISAPTPPAC